MGKNKKQLMPRFLPLLLGNYIGIFGWSLFAPLFAIIVQDKGGDAASVGLIWGFYTLVTGVSMIIFGKLSDKTHRLRTTMVLGNIFLIIASFSFLFVNNLVQIAVAQTIFAIGFGLLNPSMRALYAKLEYRGKEATEWAYMDGGNMLVMSAASVIGGFIVKGYGLAPLFITMTIAQLIGTIVLLRAVRTPAKKQR
jgi:MFS family permease